MKRDLQRARRTSPLFDTPRWVENFERALWRMWRHYEDADAGPPAPFSVAESDPLPLDRDESASTVVTTGTALAAVVPAPRLSTAVAGPNSLGLSALI